ncbi:MAG: site-specific integrase [Alphaproteobacteria bacterium]|nr:site-specific integrase [Alphaproteobacteria bacterium]
MKRFDRLTRRNSTYYIRAKIPDNLLYLSPTKMFSYSLKTNDYYSALENYRKESYKIDLKIMLLRKIDMQLKNKELVLDEADINKIIIHRLRELDNLFTLHYDDILEHNYENDSFSMFPKKQPLKDLKSSDFAEESQKTDGNTIVANTPDNNYELNCIEVYLKGYLEDLKHKDSTHHSIIKLISTIQKEDLALISKKEPLEGWQKLLITCLKGVEKYGFEKLNSLENDVPLTNRINPKVKHCLSMLDKEIQDETYGASTKTLWTKIFDEFSLTKKRQKGNISDNTIEQNRNCIETCFEIIGKKYVETLNYKDCKELSVQVFNLPKKWAEKSKKKGLTLKKMLAQENEDHISQTSAKKYLRMFKEFLTFARKRHYLTIRLEEELEIPKQTEKNKRTPFNADDLITIFNPKTYPRMNDISKFHNFWIPLISLYSGMRLNEICQLYCDDVMVQNDIYFFNLTDERPDQHIKNKQSKRRVPIHPILLEFGILDVMRKARALKKDRLFYNLSYSKKNHYANAVSNFFQYYTKKIGLDDSSKVFHSFRHTVKPTLRDANISREYQNALCGWEGNDIGEKVYGGEVPIEKLYECICKIEYPCLESTLEGLRKVNRIGSYKYLK